MSYNNRKITGAVSIRDVQQALNESSQDLRTLCTSSKINPWARYKPIAIANDDERNRPAPLTDADRQTYNWGSQLSILRTNVGDSPINCLRQLASYLIDNNGQLDTSKVNGGFLENYTNATGNIFRRLSDFVQYTGSAASTQHGYYADAGAQPNNWQDTGSSTILSMEPTLSTASRSMTIANGITRRVTIPSDTAFLTKWLGNEGGTRDVGIDPDSLTPLEVMLKDSQQEGAVPGDALNANCRRGVFIFKLLTSEDCNDADFIGKWHSWGYVIRGDNGADFIDFSSSYTDTAFYYQDGTTIRGLVDYGEYISGGIKSKWGTVEGDLLFVEFLYDSGATAGGERVLLIPGRTFCYYVSIDRTNTASGSMAISTSSLTVQPTLSFSEYEDDEDVKQYLFTMNTYITRTDNTKTYLDNYYNSDLTATLMRGTTSLATTYVLNDTTGIMRDTPTLNNDGSYTGREDRVINFQLDGSYERDDDTNLKLVFTGRRSVGEDTSTIFSVEVDVSSLITNRDTVYL